MQAPELSACFCWGRTVLTRHSLLAKCINYSVMIMHSFCEYSFDIALTRYVHPGLVCFKWLGKEVPPEAVCLKR